MATKKYFEHRREYLQNIISQTTAELKNAPAGKLRINKHHSGYQYFIRKDSKDINGKYVRKKDFTLVKALAQRDYNIKIQELAIKEKKILDRLATFYSTGDCDSYITQMHPQKASLVTPIKESDDRYIQNWLATNANPQETFMAEGLIYDNGKGVMMRSMSEVIISKILDEKGIPYVYEKTVALSKFKTVCPDFTILDVKNRREIYIEHLGLMDDAEYFAKNVKKIADYEKAGIYLGDRLLITYETRKEPLNAHLLEEKLLKML